MSVADVLANERPWWIETADVLAGLALLPDESVNCVVSSPPYWGLRDYGTATWVDGDPACDHAKSRRPINDVTSTLESVHANTNHAQEPSYRDVCGKCGARRVDKQIGLEPTPDAYVARMVAVFREVRRVLRRDGVVWLNLGDSYSGAPVGSFNGGGAILKGRNLDGHRTSGQMDKSRLPGLKPKDLIGIPWSVAFALRADGWYLRSDVIWAKPNPMPESITDRPTKAHEYLFLLSRSERYAYDADAIREEAINEGSVRRAAPSSKHRDGANGTNDHRTTIAFVERDVEIHGRNKRTVWTIATEPYPDAHFATMPTALVEPCILAGCPAGGVVLDPFAGSGTVILKALRHGRRGIGFDPSPAYVEMARRRIVADRGVDPRHAADVQGAAQLRLFEGVA